MLTILTKKSDYARLSAAFGMSQARCIILSYTWGAPSGFINPNTTTFTTIPRCFPIKCAGNLVLGTRNLRDALRRLRQGQNYSQKTPPLDMLVSSCQWCSWVVTARSMVPEIESTLSLESYQNSSRIMEQWLDQITRNLSVTCIWKLQLQWYKDEEILLSDP